MTVAEAPFSDLINKPKATLQPLTGSHAHSIRLRRRDDVDLVLTTAERYEQDHALIALAVRVLSVAVQQGAFLDTSVALRVFPWARFLPDEDLQEFLREFVETLGAADDLGNLAPVSQLIAEWRNTAEVHADPALRAALTSGTDDFGPVPEPTAG